jgi:hypothetical protein
MLFVPAERGNLAGIIGNLKTSVEGATDHAHPRIGINDPRHVGKAVELLRRVMNRIVERRRILNAAFVA